MRMHHAASTVRYASLRSPHHISKMTILFPAEQALRTHVCCASCDIQGYFSHLMWPCQFKRTFSVRVFLPNLETKGKLPNEFRKPALLGKLSAKGKKRNEDEKKKSYFFRLLWGFCHKRVRLAYKPTKITISKPTKLTEIILCINKIILFINIPK